ncbi:uncharacterized protein LOC123545532 [Mercenaria mercenaria]|uniref:uncharacterized protein LOC123545532 n=1 Tax=Mercenaria mercenaria TaxID=6596 RepID=UPI00234E41E4|nr:uncharacterized protein LOC123545532 [Mercenaria mercenaria]
MAGMVIEFSEEKRSKLAKFVGISHWICILPSFICLLLALYIQLVIEDKISFIEDYNGAILPGFLVFSGFFGLFTHILCGKVAYSNRIPEKRAKWTRCLLPAVIATAIIFLAEFISGIMCFAHIQNLEESFDSGIRLAMVAYKDDMTTKEEMDKLQMAYECCGSKSYQEWFSVAWIHPDYMNSVKTHASMKILRRVINDDVPFSCCSPHVLRPCIRHHVHDNDLHFNYDYRKSTTLHTTGCTEKLMAFYEHSVLLMAGSLVLSLSFIQLVLTICLRFLQTAVTSVSADDPEGPSVGYLFSGPKKQSGLDTTITSTEGETLLDTTADTTLTFDDDEFDGERYVDMDGASAEPLYENVDIDGASAEPFYENVAPFETGLDEEHIYNEGDVEDYLASKFAHSREKFEHIPESEFDEIPPAYMAPPPPPPPPPPDVNFNRSRPSLTKVRSNYGSYMAMNISNSSCASTRHLTSEKVPKSHRKRHKGLRVKKRSPPSPTFQTSSPKDTYIINMAQGMSPYLKRSFSGPSHTDPERIRLIGTHSFSRSPQRAKCLHETNPPKIYSSCLYKHGSTQISPRRVSPNKRGTEKSPDMVTLGFGKRRSPLKRQSPFRRVSPQKTSFKSGVSYECNHAYD